MCALHGVSRNVLSEVRRGVSERTRTVQRSADTIMNDAIYVATTLIFFALMIAFGYGCRALGRDALADRSDS